MSIKRILVPLPGSASHTGEIEMALSAAKALGAHVQALFISQPPPVTRGGVSVSELGRTATVASVNGLAEERERTVRDAREVFAQACAKVGIPMLSANDEPRQPARSILARSRGIVCGNRGATGRWLRPSGRRKRHRNGIAHGHCR